MTRAALLALALALTTLSACGNGAAGTGAGTATGAGAGTGAGTGTETGAGTGTVAGTAAGTVAGTAAGTAAGAPALADVVAVAVSGSPGAYTFAVTVRSPDTGCDRYADWWEVVRPDGALVHRRVLGHSHVDEQPFARSGGPVAIAADDEVIVRAHLNPGGYGGAAMRGSPAVGFAAAPEVGAAFAPDLARVQPLPDGCAF